jgi:hypothetical protein
VRKYLYSQQAIRQGILRLQDIWYDAATFGFCSNIISEVIVLFRMEMLLLIKDLPSLVVPSDCVSIKRYVSFL